MNIKKIFNAKQIKNVVKNYRAAVKALRANRQWLEEKQKDCRYWRNRWESSKKGTGNESCLMKLYDESAAACNFYFGVVGELEQKVYHLRNEYYCLTH